MTQPTVLNEVEIRQELVEMFGLTTLTTEDQKIALDKMMEALIQAIFIQTFDRLGEAGAAEYEKLLENALSPEEIAKFLESRIPGYNVFVKEIVADFKHSMQEALEE